MEVCTPGNVLEKEVEDGIGLFLLQPDDASCN